MGHPTEPLMPTHGRPNERTRDHLDGAHHRPAAVEPAGAHQATGDTGTPPAAPEPTGPPDGGGWWREANRLDVAVYAAIAATPTPELDRIFRRGPHGPRTTGSSG